MAIALEILLTLMGRSVDYFALVGEKVVLTNNHCTVDDFLIILHRTNHPIDHACVSIADHSEDGRCFKICFVSFLSSFAFFVGFSQFLESMGWIFSALSSSQLTGSIQGTLREPPKEEEA